MSFEKPMSMFILLLIVVLFIIFRTRFYRRFFIQVKKFWFYRVTRTRQLSNIIYAISFLILVVAVGDLRGKEEVIEGNIPTQKTLMIIDNSLSMLVEDIRPNRINKALLMARHLIRNSYGHQISIAVFSDILKQIIPFTDDIDILEARLETLSGAKSEGGSNIGLTLSEAFQYFKTKDGYEKGNIILYTDGEEHGDTEFKVPPEITMAVIAVGSENGGKIPIRRKDGQFQKYKKYNNEEIISKIDKNFFSKLEKSGESVRVWFAQSYSLPTEEILGYLTKVHESSFQKGSFRQRPVKGIPLILLFIIVYLCSVVLSRFKTFKVAILLCFICVSTIKNVQADDNERLNHYLEKYKKGSITKEEKLALAQIYMQMNENAKSASVYRNTIKNLDEEKVEDVFNFATTLLKEGKSADAMSLYKYLNKDRKVSDELKDVIKKNMLFAMNQEKKENQKNEDSEQDQDEKDNKENQSNKKDKENKQDKNNKQKKDNQGKQQKGDQKEKGKNSKDDKSKPQNGEESSDKQSQPKDKSEEMNGEDKKDKKDSEKKEEDQGEKQEKEKEIENGKTFEEIKKEIELKKKNGVKGVLKQIMNDDANLQKQFINSSSNENSSNSKDW